MTQTPAQRSLQARIAAHARFAKEDAREVTAPARKAFMDRFDREVDPEGVLDPRERAVRAAHARTAHFLKLAQKSAKARRRRAGK